MAEFLPAFEKMIIAEGGYRLTEVKLDHGGRTFAGISSRYHADWPGWEYVKAGNFADPVLTALVREFYADEFWEPVHGEELIEQPVAESIFDFAVNAGVRTAVKLAQIVSGATPDGIAGPKTILAINALGSDEFVTKYALAKIARYAGICDRDPDQKKFLLGWINRTLDGVAA
jgi:lysozyme family protein